MKAADLPKSRVVLLLVDFINPLNFPKAGELAPAAVEAARATAALKKALRADGVPAIYANDNFGSWRSDFPALTRGLVAGRGPSAQMARLLRPARDDLSVLKPRHSAFYGTPLDILLDSIGAREIIITGVAADICVQITATDAFLRNFKIKVPSNCIASETEQAKEQALEHMRRVLRCDTQPR
ncbi:MAG: isochorismatase family cysteine hydrolase [Pseudomonadota bacterium]